MMLFFLFIVSFDLDRGRGGIFHLPSYCVRSLIPLSDFPFLPVRVQASHFPAEAPRRFGKRNHRQHLSSSLSSSKARCEWSRPSPTSHPPPPTPILATRARGWSQLLAPSFLSPLSSLHAVCALRTKHKAKCGVSPRLLVAT